MKKTAGILFASMTGAALLLGLAATVVGESKDGPRHRRRGGSGNTYSVAEPASIALLGAGLVTLGLYARKKNGKKK